MAARQARKQETRARILASAADAVRTRGLDGASVGEVMAGAGLTVGGFYAHFDSKEDLLHETLREMMSAQIARWLDEVATLPAVDRRRRAARGYLSRTHRDSVTPLHCPLPGILGELARTEPQHRAVVAEHLDAWARAMTGSDDPQERQRALAAIATMVGGQTLARALGPTAFSDELLAAAKAAIA